MPLRIGPYRAIYEARLGKFQSCGYPEIDAAALAQFIVAQPLPEVALSCSSGYLEAIVQRMLVRRRFSIRFSFFKVRINSVRPFSFGGNEHVRPHRKPTVSGLQ